MRVLCSPYSYRHRPPAEHPDSPARVQAVLQGIQRESGVLVQPCTRLATRAEMQRVHAESYVDRVWSHAFREGALDLETWLSVDSLEAIRASAGLALEMVDVLSAGDSRCVWALTRPPGHHAERAMSMGYCVFNNMALAVDAAQSKGIEKILVLDWDVHRGNGTRALIENRPGVVWVDLHQDRLFPSEEPDESVVVWTRGGALEMALPGLCTDNEYDVVMRGLLAAICEDWSPDLVLISSGFDAHWQDEQGGMRLNAEAFGWMGQHAKRIADTHCGGRLGVLLEGGYCLEALPDCAQALTRGLLEVRELPTWVESCREQVTTTLHRVVSAWRQMR